MSFMIIIPDRGDRQQLMEFCHKQMDRMHSLDHSNQSAWVKSAPTDDKCDLIPRIKKGIKMAANVRLEAWSESCDYNPAWKTNFVDTPAEWAFIVENDDYYPATYIQYLLPLLDGLDFIGWQNTFYYNIKTRRYSRLEHETHSSLFCTGFRLSALDDFEWPPDDYPFLDIALWKHAKQSGKNWKLLRTDNPCVGIKGHGMGKMGGKGHRMELNRADPEMKWFREKLNDEEAFKFYQSIV